jgi:phosphoribosylaminoimidazolecarboxamide formyltransferase/IMP cyclohydrolase
MQINRKPDMQSSSRRALVSVSNKKGLIDFAQSLSALGYEIISTGGTAAALNEKGIPVLKVSDLTSFPEILDGRVKTLHPAVSILQKIDRYFPLQCHSHLVSISDPRRSPGKAKPRESHEGACRSQDYTHRSCCVQSVSLCRGSTSKWFTHCVTISAIQTLNKEGAKEADIIEQIDIGGVTLLRAAAKNFESVLVVVDPVDYEPLLAKIKV